MGNEMRLKTVGRFNSGADSEGAAKDISGDGAGAQRVLVPGADLLLDGHVRVHPELHRVRNSGDDGQRGRRRRGESILPREDPVTEPEQLRSQ